MRSQKNTVCLLLCVVKLIGGHIIPVLNNHTFYFLIEFKGVEGERKITKLFMEDNNPEF